MQAPVRAQFEAFPDPSPATVPIGPGQLDRLDDDLHYGWAWYRYRSCFRRPEGLRILDAGCGTGVSTLGLARLNPGSTVLGLDASPRAIELAGLRAAVDAPSGVSFRLHDLDDPLPAAGPFDYVVCRGVLGQAEDPVRILKNLARALDDRGLLLATFPARSGRGPARRMRRAAEALAPPGASPADTGAIGLELYQSLRPDHPIRQFAPRIRPPGPFTVEAFVATFLNESETDFELEEAISALEAAGLQFLYAATRLPWQPGRVLTGEATEEMKSRVGGLPPARLAALMDALDPTLHGGEYRLFACPADFEPRLPNWPERRAADPAAFERLVPHRTGLAVPLGSADARGRPTYRALSGALAQLDPRTDFLFLAVDDRRTCGEIDRLALVRTGVAEPVEAAQGRWLELANFGLLLLESTDLRQHVDCRHLGPIRDRLDCACPRLWIRLCDRHGHCSLDQNDPNFPRDGTRDAALRHLGIDQIASCDSCPDYSADE